MRTLMNSSLAIALAACGALAQLKPGSLSIKAGDTFVVNRKVMVTFVQLGAGSGTNAGKYDFYLSTNGGSQWKEFEAAWQGPKGNGDTVKYEWTVPNSPTTTAQWRACLMSGGHCTDTAYVLKSGNFTISATASPIQAQAPRTAGKVDFDAATGSLAIAFSLASPAHVALQAFDSQGRLLATLLDADRAAGDHALSLFSNRLRDMHGAIAFKLTWGGASLTRSLVLP
jgi:hypothetical protein